ncbi:FGGY-family carbohydrate kinase [Pseudomonas sp. NA-150]|uniref:xylulokinase n=1 Tax=Pseudomonas sp. NA-150 TaxID=3367525 RepID=UPI0037C992E1
MAAAAITSNRYSVATTIIVALSEYCPLKSRALLIGVDMGTSSTRVVIVDENGSRRAAASHPSRLLNPARQVFKQEPEEMYASVLRAIKDALSQVETPPAVIAGVAICGQMAGISTVGRHWEATTPYDSWLDLRCAPQVDQLKEYEQLILECSGGPVTANHAAKWLYWRDQHPEIYRRINKIIMPAAYVAGRMAALSSDDAFMDYTYLGSNSFSDSQALDWNHSLLSEFRLDADLLPRLVKPWDVIGAVSQSTAAACGLLAGTPIFAGCGDIAASMLGAAAFKTGQLLDIAGTGSVLATVMEEFVVDTHHKTLTTFRHCLPELFYSAAYVGGGGMNFNWLGLANDDFSKLDALVGAPLSDRNKLLFLPHLGGSHAPFDAAMSGAFVGLDWRHDKSDRCRAMMESIAYEYARFLQCINDMQVSVDESSLLGVGGGANSQLFNQIKADVLGLTYHQRPVAEYGAMGAALLAGRGAGVLPDLQKAAEQWQEPIVNNALPDPLKGKFYAGMRKAYEQMRSNLTPVFLELQSVSLH